MLLPFKKQTQTSDNGFVWHPQTFQDFLIELENLKREIQDCCYFRGQRISSRLLDSTFARKMKQKNGLMETERYSQDKLTNPNFQHELAKEFLRNLDEIPVLKSFLAHPSVPFVVNGYPIDMLFQYHIHVQQNAKDPNLIEFISSGTNFLDFSLNWKIGLFFANRKRFNYDEGALFVIRQKNLGPVYHPGETPFQNIIFDLRNKINQDNGCEYPGIPLLPWPRYQLNNIFDPKPKLQEAVYIAQMDFRKDFEMSWKELYEKTKNQTYLKIILPEKTVKEVTEYLNSQGITEEYLFPETKFDEIISRKTSE